MTTWQEIIKKETTQPYFQELQQFIASERKEKIIFPDESDVFNAFNLCPFDSVNVVILGQDPYHDTHQAHGLSFSVQKGVPFPPSLRNIFKELHDDLGYTIPMDNGDLTHWAKQGVLLLNTVLTVEKDKPNSHANRGWEHFTNAILCALNEKTTPVIFVLWGKYAQQKAKCITQSHHVLLCAPHPSPLSAYRGFFGSKPFSQINALLQQNNQPPINWQL